MANKCADPRIIMHDREGVPCQRISTRNEDDIAHTSVRNSFNPTILRDASYNTPIARSMSVNNEIPIQMENLPEEMIPLQRKTKPQIKRSHNHKKHSCTDVHCLIIFICFVFAWVYIASYAFSQGDLNKVLVPTDSRNAKCGLDSGLRHKKKLFFFNLDNCLDPMTPITGCSTKQVCVESCPNSTFVWQESKEHERNLRYIKEKLICDAVFDKANLKTFSEVKKSIENGYCSAWYLKSRSLFNHCVWDFSEEVCNILPRMFSGRYRRASVLSSNFVDYPFYYPLAEFLNYTKSMCAKEDQSSMWKNNEDNIEQSNSNLNRILTAIISKFNYSNKEILGENITADLKNSWKVLVFAFIIHIFAILLFITLLRWLAGLLVWISIGGVILGLSLAFVYSFNEHRYWANTPHVPNHSTYVMAKIQNILETENVWLYITIAVGVALVIILLLVLVIRKRIKIAVAIIKEASKAITNIKSAIFFPIFPGLLYISVATLTIIIMLYLSSIGEFSFIMVQRNNSGNYAVTEKCICTGPLKKPYILGGTCKPELFEKFCHIGNDLSKPCIETSCSFNEIVKSPKTQWFMLFNIFGFLWVTFFISAYEDMVLACTFSMWYWTFNKKHISNFPILKAVYITTFYHMGTIAFGSLILSICRMIRYVLELIEKKAKMYNNTFTRAIICCMQCFFWFLENFLRFLNKNAYIVCAIHSTSFCASSRKAFGLITHNCLRVCAVDKVSEFLFFLSKLLVTGCTSCITYYLLKTYPSIVQIHYLAVPVTLVAIATYIMSYFIFSTYSMAVDTLFFCFLEDSTENDGSAENPFYMSRNLNKLLSKSRTKRKKLRK